MSNSNLRNFQKDFLAGIKSNHPLANNKLSDLIVPGGSLKSSQDALDVYREGYFARLTEALSETYEITWKILGDEEFFKLCRLYIENTPSTHFNLNHYGAYLASFIDQSQWSQEFHFLTDVARLEWSLRTRFDLHFEPGPEPKLLLELANKNTKFFLWKGCELFETPCPAGSILHEVRLGIDRGQDRLPDHLDWNAAERMVIYRDHQQVFIRDLSVSQYRVLQALQKPTTLEEALHTQNDEIQDRDSIQALFNWLAEGRLLHPEQVT